MIMKRGKGCFRRPFPLFNLCVRCAPVMHSSPSEVLSPLFRRKLMRPLFSRTVPALFLAVLLFSSPCIAGSRPSSGSLNAAQTTELLKTQPEGSLSILDVRTPAEFLAGHAPNALNIPLNELTSRLPDIPEGPLLIICRSGRRAHTAYDILIQNGRSPEQMWFLTGYTDYSSGTPRFSD